jgi:hypothetical protein
MKRGTILRQAASVPSRGLIASRHTVSVTCDGKREYLVARVPSWRRDVRGMMTVTAPTARAAAKARTKLRQDPAWLDFLDDITIRWPGECRLKRR